MKLLWLSNSPHMPTGYGRQTNYITRYLAGDLPSVPNPEPNETYILGLQQIGASVKWGNIKILPIFGDIWAKDSLPYWLDTLNPSVFFTLMDVWVFPELFQIGQRHTWCPYVPIDSKPLTSRIGDPMKSARVILPFSDFGVQMLEDYGLTNHFKIHHGYDANIYKKLPDEEILKLKKNYGLEDKFVILSVGMNVGFRKGFSRLMEAFKLLNDEHEDTVLWLHTDPRLKRGIPLEHIAQSMGLKQGKNIIFTPNFRHGTPYPEKRLNELYNLADVHSLATMGEGFGLPLVESMGAETPNVITDFSTTREFIGNNERGLAADVMGEEHVKRIPSGELPRDDYERGLGADVATWWTTPLACKQAMVEIKGKYHTCSKCHNIDKISIGMYDRLKQYYEDRKLLKEHGKKASDFVKKQYEWSVVLPRWNELLNKLKEMGI